MRLAVLQFMAGFCGALGFMLFLLSLGTDYWLLSSESCDPQDKKTETPSRVITKNVKDGLKQDPNDFKSTVVSYHEGLFWRCSFRKHRKDERLLDFWISTQPTGKICMPVYLSSDPLPEKRRSTDTAALHRTFWCIMSILGFTLVMIGVFVTICGIPRANRRFYEAGGALFITGGFLLLVVVVTFTVWVQASGSLERYILLRRSSVCPDLHLNLYYGPSFMMAPPASFFSIICGIFLLLTQAASGTVSAKAGNKPPSVQKEKDASELE